MKHIRVTDPFPADVKPVHEGIYKQPDHAGGYSYWNRDAWSVARPTVEEAFRNRHSISNDQHRRWIGLADAPLSFTPAKPGGK